MNNSCTTDTSLVCILPYPCKRFKTEILTLTSEEFSNTPFYGSLGAVIEALLDCYPEFDLPVIELVNNQFIVWLTKQQGLRWDVTAGSTGLSS